MVILASGIARGRVRTTTTPATTTVESRKMAAMLTGTWSLGLPYVRTHDDDDDGDDDSGVAQDGGQVDRDMNPWFTVYFFDIGHSCYD